MRALYTLVVLLGSTATAFAQTPEVVAQVESLLQSERQAVDVEVLRRLLNQRFGFADKVDMQLPPHQPYIGSTTVINPNLFGGGGPINRPLVATLLPSHQLSQPIGPFDGTALPGGGVVYTLRIPAGADLTVDPKTNAVGLGNNCSQCHTDVAFDGATQQVVHKGQALALACSKCHEGGASAKELKEAAPITAWERTKHEIAGDKIEPLAKPQPKPKAERSPMCKPGDIAEQIVQVLATNAKNLDQLAKTERVTVVVTFDELPGQTKTAGVLSGNTGYSQDESQALNLGSLHFKQQKYKEAAEAFEKGLVRFNDGVITVIAPEGTADDDFNRMRIFQASIRNYYKDLSQAHLKLEQLEQASKALELAKTFRIEFAKSLTAAKPKLPAKLIVSVTKADIDAAKTPGDFRKAITVDRTGFPRVKK